jgi:hypothetical protein
MKEPVGPFRTDLKRLAIFACGCLAACIGLGLVGGYLYFRFILFLPRQVTTDWLSLPDPPSRPVELLGAGSRCLAILAADGGIYSYCNPRIFGMGTWQALAPSPGYSGPPCLDSPFPEPPEGTLESIEYCDGSEEGADFHRFALLDDGTVKEVRVYTRELSRDPLYDGLALALLLVVGGCCGLALFPIALGLVLVAFRRVWRP